MEFGFSYESFSSNISDEVAVKIDYQHDYMIGFNDGDDAYHFLSISEYPGLADDMILASFGWTDKGIMLEFLEEMESKHGYTIIGEFEDISNMEEFVEHYPYMAIDDIIFYYGMREFEVGYGPVWHEIKLKDLDKFIKKYL